MTDDVIEQAARVLSTQTTCDGQPHPSELHQRQARALADAGLLRQEPPTSPDISTSLTRVEVIDRHGSAYTAWDVTDVVLHVQDGGRTLKVFHAGEGLLRQDPPTRDEIADELAGWPIGSGYYSQSVPVDEAQAMADAVLALWEGRKR